MEKVNSVMIATIVLVAICFVQVESALEEKILRVVSKVHADPNVFVSVEEKRAKRHGNCVDTGAVDDNPVCASNGKQYMNKDVFEFHKCIIQARFGEIIEIVDMEVCKNAKKEDIDVPDIDYM
ncbi:unnamed protein product [Peronospora belbahrii]|nr:unnamed protein product [Peronospora belbahrii]